MLVWRRRVLGLIVAVIGAAFFNLIDGVFGVVPAAAALAAFFVITLLILRLPQTGDDGS
jgi:hypothetical protein